MEEMCGIMELINILLGIIIILGIADLIVGVSNDAANFTNSAIASKVASIKTIMIVVSIGILFGAISSSGMMEIARKGIFKPEFFTLNELFILCLAVMLSDILLLDLYNTFGLPTSTTVSLVFELLGAALVLALFKSGNGISTFDMINSSGALKIISGIFLSVLVAFMSGMLFQFLFRLSFSYDLDKTYKRYAGIFAGICLSIIATFIIIKGLKKTELLPAEFTKYVKTNLGSILLVNLVIMTVLSQLLVWLKVDVFKIIILIGTGALAMAFAGNDLVNFIGVPMAALNTFDLIEAAGGDGTVLGTALAGQIPSSNIYLIIAGGIMAATLWLSKKARTVQQTEISLASQNEKVEVFESNQVARMFVQATLTVWDAVRVFIPAAISNRVNTRFKQTEFMTGVAKTDYDYLRASVNIVTASSIIMAGTMLKLPLSTTFITFMVAMGTSFADRAWGRDNAVQRVSGVMTVVGGWFMTAMIATTVAGLMATIIYSTGLYMGVILFALIVFTLFKLNKIHRARMEDYEKRSSRLELFQNDPRSGITRLTTIMVDDLNKIDDTLNNLLKAGQTSKRKYLKTAEQQIKQLVREYQHNFFRAISYANSDQSSKEILSLHQITKLQTEMRHITGSLWRIHAAITNRVDIYNTPLESAEMDDLASLVKLITELTEAVRNILSRDKSTLNKTKAQGQVAKDLQKQRVEINTAQLKRIKEGKSKIKTSIYYLILLDELININQKLLESVVAASQIKVGKK
jgi:phosphate/sulfate permease/DnaJ-domain-containing protein 1